MECMINISSPDEEVYIPMELTITEIRLLNELSNLTHNVNCRLDMPTIHLLMKTEEEVKSGNWDYMMDCYKSDRFERSKQLYGI